MTSFKDLPLCTLDSCNEVQEGHGYCRSHYFQWLKTGDPLPPARKQTATRPSREIRFEDRYTIEDDHWIWNGPIQRGKPGAVRINGVFRLPQQYAWEQEHGPLAPFTRLLRTCDEVLCISPAHREIY